MNLILRNDPVWLGLLPTPDDSTTLVLIGSDGHQVAVPASLLLAVSPLLRSSLTGLLPPAYCPCFLSLPATREALQVVRDILATGTVAGDHVEELEEVRQVLRMLGVEALIVSYQLESIQVAQVFERDIKEEVAAEGPDISLGNEEVKMEIIVKIEDKENTGVKASNTFRHSPRLKNVTLKSNIEADKESNTFRKSLIAKNLTSKLSLNLMNPYNSVPNMTTFFCNFCQEEFAFRSLLKGHVESVHKTGKSCNFCPLKFSLKQTLRRHIKSEHAESENTCYLCSKKFSEKRSLVEHIQSNHDQIKVKCNLCPKKFSRKGNLKIHIKSVHEKIKFQCSLCAKKFTQKRNLVLHIKSIHEVRKFQCNICPQKLSNKRSLVQHIQAKQD